jgi:hypothetical protein
VSKRASLVLAAAALAGAALAAGVACRPPPSDEQRIRALLDEAARAAEEKRVGDVVRDVSERFQGEGLDRRGVKQLVAFHVVRGDWLSVSIAGAAVEASGDAGRAEVDVVLSRSGKGTPLRELLPEQATVHRFQLTLAREAGGWKVTAARWRPITLAEAAAGPALAPAGSP